MELFPNNVNYTEYVAGDNLKNDISDYSYYTDSSNETTSENCTQSMLNCSKQAYEEEEGQVTEVIDGADDSKTKTITLLDFSNYLIPSEEDSENID